MHTRRKHAAFSIVLTFVMMAAFVLSAVGQSRSHGPAEYLQIASLSAVDLPASELEHSHDTDDAAGKLSGHPKSHNPSDHTHDVPADPGRVDVALRVFAKGWRVASVSTMPPSALDRLERPPRA